MPSHKRASIAMEGPSPRRRPRYAVAHRHRPARHRKLFASGQALFSLLGMAGGTGFGYAASGSLGPALLFGVCMVALVAFVLRQPSFT